MRNRVLASVVILSLVQLVSHSTRAAAQAGLPADVETLRRSIMRPDEPTLRQWLGEYRAAPLAYLDPGIRLSLPPYGGSLSLLDHLSYVPSERDQGSCGSCWNWAGTGVIEIALSVQGAVRDRLSTQFLNSCKIDSYACCGGWLTSFADWYRGVGFAIPWSNANASYYDTAGQCQAGESTVSCGTIASTPSYPITSIDARVVPTVGVGKQAALANIKNVLNQNKAIWFGFFLPNDGDWDAFFTHWGGSAASEEAVWDPDFACGHSWDQRGGGGHAVLLVGYNDEGPVPYWLALNSWGTAGGKRPGGLFRLAMDLDYDCAFPAGADTVEALTFQTLDLSFGGASTCTYSVSPPSNAFSSAGGSGSVAVATQPGCPWAAAEDLEWVTLGSAGGMGSGAFGYTVDPNPTSTPRSGTITVADKAFTIAQEGANSTLPSNLILNPSFESGPLNWKEFSSGGYDLLYNVYRRARSGNWFVWLGGYNHAWEYAYQPVTLPANATQATLAFSYCMETTEDPADPAGPFDFAYAGAVDPATGGFIPGASTTLSNLNATAVVTEENPDATCFYETLSGIDLTSLRGRSFWLAFALGSDYSNPSQMFVDDVVLDVTLPDGEGSLRVESPNWRETWRRRQTRVLQWRTLGEVGDVRIQLRRRTPYGWRTRTIVDRLPNTGYYYWTIPGKLVRSDRYKLRVTAADAPWITDDSDKFFRIR